MKPWHVSGGGGEPVVIAGSWCVAVCGDGMEKIKNKKNKFEK